MADQITIDEFAKVDLRVAKIISAEHVEEARKLLKVRVSLGGDHERTIFAGIKAAYDPESLVGRKRDCGCQSRSQTNEIWGLAKA